MDGTIVVSTLVKIVAEKLGSALLNEIGLLWSVKKDLEGLENTIATIRDVLDEAEQYFFKNKQVYNWLRKLKEVVYDADDILDNIYFEAERREAESNGQTSKVISCFVSNVNLFNQLKLSHKIKSITKRLDTIAAQKAKFHLQSMVVESREICINNWETLSKIDEDRICGRDSEREKILSQLMQMDGNVDVSIISIVGLGGVGKTTLAQLAYNNKDILKQHFDYKIWVHVSQDFNVGRIVRAMIESISQSNCELENLNAIAEKLTKELKGKRLLLILDDIWNENQEKWEQLKDLLKSAASGSKIIATTRSMRVSKIMNATCTFELEGLSEEMSWNLFKQKAFCGSERDLNPHILRIAKEIVKKCGGIPLALKALGSTMQFKKSVKEWKDTRDSDIWNIRGGDQAIASLRLSYIYLPSQLKECFTYCSILPKDQVIFKQELIGQWIAHGLISFTKSMGGMEVDKGNEYFEQLVQLSFIQNVAEKADGKVTCNMHDLVHEVAKSIVSQDLLVIKDTEVVTNKNISCRYMYLINFVGKVKPTIMKKVRALHVDGGNSSVLDIVSKAQCLRSLVLDRIVFDTWSICFTKFIYLRYICISRCELTVIPYDIGSLWSLQALHLRECYKITYLPESIGKLVNLITLELTLPELKNLPNSIGQCQSLQNLIVCSNEIEGISNSLGQLVDVRSLNFSQCFKLKRVHVDAYGQFHSISSINFSGCEALDEIPVSIGTLISLESLNMSMRTKLKHLPESIGNLHNLRVMNLSGCGGLEEVPMSIGYLVSLESLNLSMCTKLRCLPESIGNLQNLCVMNLQRSRIEALPSSIRNLQKLINLNLDNVCLHGMPIGICKLTCLQRLSIFHVGRRNNYARISELEHLNLLSGNLKISGLEYLNDPREVAQANLKEKKNLDHLRLMWGPDAFLSDHFEDWLAVLQAFQPPSSIKSFELLGYSGVKYPNWMMLVGDENITSLPYLNTLTLSCLFRCSALPSLAELPHLKYLNLYRLASLRNFSGHFPSLVELHLSEMLNLEKLTTINLVTNNVYTQAFPRLSKLLISSCPKLRMQPHLPPSVVELELEKSNEELLSGIEFSDGESSLDVDSSSLCLRTFSIKEMKSSTKCILLKQLSSLTKLEFYKCELNCLPESMRHLGSLRELLIYHCKGLHALPEWLGELKSLEKLYICLTPVTCLPQSMQHLNCLRELEIDCCTGPHELPEWLGKLRSLENLAISGAPLTCLPQSMQHLSSLRVLIIDDCKGLQALPEWLGKLKSLEKLVISETPLTCLPHSMQQLTALQMLRIYQCPELKRRSESTNGKDWHLISHIPFLDIE